MIFLGSAHSKNAQQSAKDIECELFARMVAGGTQLLSFAIVRSLLTLQIGQWSREFMATLLLEMFPQRLWDSSNREKFIRWMSVSRCMCHMLDRFRMFNAANFGRLPADYSRNLIGTRKGPV